jgi:hypothetical protein
MDPGRRDYCRSRRALMVFIHSGRIVRPLAYRGKVIGKRTLSICWRTIGVLHDKRHCPIGGRFNSHRVPCNEWWCECVLREKGCSLVGHFKIAVLP